jgi:O-antigen/teichoic acid export membrane protein
MLKELKTLARETALYGMSSVLGKMLIFMLTPLLTHLLAPQDNGVVQTAYSCMAFVAVVYALGLDVAYLRLGRRDGKPDPGAFTGALITVLALAFPVTLLLTFFAAPVAVAIGIPAELASVVRLSAWILVIDAVATIPYIELRGSHQALRFVYIRLANIVLTLALTWLFVRTLHLGVRGAFLANLVSNAATLLLLAPIILANLGTPERARLREMIAFGVPLMAAGLGSMAVQVADRPMMTRMRGLELAGIYGTCYRLGIGMQLFINMFDQAWKPFVLERADRPEVDAIIARVLTYFAVLGGWVFLGIAFFAAPLVEARLFAGRSLINSTYWSGLPIVPVVTLGYLFNGLYFVMLAPLMIDKRMTSVGVVTWLGAAVNVGTNIFWIPRWGMMGAAWATCVAYGAMAAAIWAVGRRTRRVPYEWLRLSALAAWTALLWGVSTRVGVPARVVLAAAYPAGLWVSGFLHDTEVVELRALLRLKPRTSAPA